MINKIKFFLNKFNYSKLMYVIYLFYLIFVSSFISFYISESESAVLENRIMIDNSLDIHSILHGNNGYIYSSSTVPGPLKEEGIISVINSTTNSVIDTIRVGKSPTELAINPNNNLLYVANFDNKTISVINTTTNSVIDTITVGNSPEELVINPNNNLLYVANSGNNTVSVINTTNNSIMKTWVTYTGVIDIIVNPLNNHVYTLTLHEIGDTVSIRNTTDGSALEKIKLNKPNKLLFNNNNSL